MPIYDVISDAKNPIKLWIPLAEVEQGAVQQLLNVANLPILHKWVAVMPDVHVGYGATVGTVMVTKDAIVPSAVGVDIGCGMYAVKTDLTPDILMKNQEDLLHSLQRSIPTGFHSNSKVSQEVESWKRWNDIERVDVFCTWDKEQEVLNRAKSQMGSLGGGNHFVEICLDEDNHVWVMLHSGSRNTGLKIANYWINHAKELMRKFHIKLDDPYLAYIPKGTTGFDGYWYGLQWAQEYAWMNRVEMMRKVLKDLAYLYYGEANQSRVNRVMEVHCHHNYADIEHHFGEDVIVVRKGATRARLNEYGIIPGSMGAKSYIVQGKGNKDSFCSSSHGAGRKLGRAAAKRQFNVEDLKAQTEGITCRKDAGVVDEIPAAYKDIDTVIERQSDLVTPVAKLRQVICMKGGGNPDRD